MEQLQDPWEDLDIDDSDLPSILRPCNRRSSPPPTASKHPPEDLRLPEQQHSASKSVSCNRTIPGPAGTVLAAMIRKSIARENQSFVTSMDNGENFNDSDHNIAVTPTQEYIRRAIEDTVEFDDDFIRSPWLSALRFLGADDGVIPGTPISCMKKRFDAHKVNQVVAIIKSCSPNGHGGLIASLKDPTGAIGATIHPTVLSKSEFGKNLGVGAVLVLQKVAIFSPVRTAHYLNITLKNVVKVFGQSSGTLGNNNDPVHLLEYNDLDLGSGRIAKTLEKFPITQNVTTEGTARETSGGTGGRLEDSQNHSLIQKQNLFAKSFKWSEDMTKSEARIAVEQQDHVCGGNEHASAEIPDGGILNNSCTPMANSVTKNNEEIQETIAPQMQGRKALIDKSFVPQWTDEQLDELFMDEEYNGF